jgi:DNA replication ATP-dependent helicase Dna2
MRPDARRLVNVALSRAKARLVVYLGDADRANPLLEQIANLISPPAFAEPETPICQFVGYPDFPACVRGRLVRVDRYVGRVVDIIDGGLRFVLIDAATGLRRSFVTEIVKRNCT